MGNSFLLIIAGLLVFYLVISDKWRCVEGAAACMTGKSNNGGTSAAPANALPQLPQVKPQAVNFPSLTSLALNTNWAVNNDF